MFAPFFQNGPRIIDIQPTSIRLEFELNKAGLLHQDANHVLGKLTDVIEQWDITKPGNDKADKFYRAGPAGIRTSGPHETGSG